MSGSKPRFIMSSRPMSVANAAIPKTSFSLRIRIFSARASEKGAGALLRHVEFVGLQQHFSQVCPHVLLVGEFDVAHRHLQDHC